MVILPGDVLKGRYRIIREICEGGFGTIYLARDESLEVDCAIKHNSDPTPRAQTQFKSEARILANLDHPNLVRVTDYFIEQNGSQFLVMNYIEGVDLHDMLEDKGKPIDPSLAVRWIEQICDALSYMHDQSPPVIHRDIKPANIIINRKGKAILVDFGIAKTYQAGKATTRGALGVSAGYSSPEQYGGSGTDACSDIYSLGATLYTVITLRTPPESVDIMAGRDKPPKPAHIINPSVPITVSEAIQKAIQIDRGNRFQSVAEFKSALSTSIPPLPSQVGAGQVAPSSASSAGTGPYAATPAYPPSNAKRWVRVGLMFIFLILLLVVLSPIYLPYLPFSQEISDHWPLTSILFPPSADSPTNSPQPGIEGSGETPFLTPVPTEHTCVVATGYTSGKANIRGGPDINSRYVSYVVEGDVLVVLSEGQTDWLRVRLSSGLEGWIHKNLCK